MGEYLLKRLIFTRRRKRFALIILAALAIVSLLVFFFLEYKIKPLVSEAAASRGRSYATELINKAVESAAAYGTSLVSVSEGQDGVVSVETDMKVLAEIRRNATDAIMNQLNDRDVMKFSVPLGNLMGSNMVGGRGIPIEIRLVPIGDITADVRTEFVEAGINQTLHKIIFRVRISFDIFVAGDSLKVDVISDIGLAETVIVGKVPDAYTAINRYEIDEDEENDLNDYAATLP